MNPPSTYYLAVVIAHILLSAAQGIAHLSIPVSILGWQHAFAGVVILLVPIFGGIQVMRVKRTSGGLLLLVSGLAALALEGSFHFLVMNPDHVEKVDAGRQLFLSTAVLRTVGDLALVVAAAILLTN